MNTLVYYYLTTFTFVFTIDWFGKEQENLFSTNVYLDNDDYSVPIISLSKITSFNSGGRRRPNAKRLAIDWTIVHHQLTFDDCFRCLCAVS